MIPSNYLGSDAGTWGSDFHAGKRFHVSNKAEIGGQAPRGSHQNQRSALIQECLDVGHPLKTDSLRDVGAGINDAMT